MSQPVDIPATNDDQIPSSGESNPESNAEIPISDTKGGTFEIAGFWRRWLAFTIDGIILAVPIFILGFAFRDLAFSIGPYGRIIGYSIVFIYWGFFYSKYGGGQTLGKRVMKTAVVDQKGDFLSLGKALLRAMVLVLIFSLNGWAIPIMQNPLVAGISTIIVFGGSLALVYGLIFNRKTRQGIHDLLAASYVIKIPRTEGIFAPEIPRIHKIVSFSLIGLVLIIGVVGFFIQRNNPTFGMLTTEEWRDIKELQSTLLQSNEFFSASVVRSDRQELGGPKFLKDLKITVWSKKSCRKYPDYCQEVIQRIARLAFEQYEGIDHLSGMRIFVTNTFDLGLATGYLTRSEEWTIQDWRKQLNLLQTLSSST